MNDILMKNFETMVLKDTVTVIHSDFRDGVLPKTVATVSVDKNLIVIFKGSCSEFSLNQSVIIIPPE